MVKDLTNAQIFATSCTLLLRKGNKFDFVSGNFGKPALLPIAFCSFNALGGARNEIPPDMTHTLQWLATDKHEPRSRFCPQAHIGPGTEDNHGAWFSALWTAGHDTFGDIDRELFVITWNRQLTLRLHRNVYI